MLTVRFFYDYTKPKKAMAKQYAGFSPYDGFVLNLSGSNWIKSLQPLSW